MLPTSIAYYIGRLQTWRPYKTQRLYLTNLNEWASVLVEIIHLDGSLIVKLLMSSSCLAYDTDDVLECK